jgi:hypothetical protein
VERPAVKGTGHARSTTGTGGLAHLQRCSRFSLSTVGGGASKGQRHLAIAGRPIYVGERKPGIATCRDDVVAALETLVAGGGGAGVHREGGPWGDGLVRTPLVPGDGRPHDLTRPARRPPYFELERVGSNLYRVVPSREGLGSS